MGTPKPLPDRVAALRARKAQLAAQLTQLEAKARVADRKRETRRKIVVGGAILHAIEKDPALADVIKALLGRVVGRGVDREVIADLLPPVVQASAPAPAPATFNNRPATAFPPAAKALFT